MCVGLITWHACYNINEVYCLSVRRDLVHRLDSELLHQSWGASVVAGAKLGGQAGSRSCQAHREGLFSLPFLVRWLRADGAVLFPAPRSREVGPWVVASLGLGTAALEDRLHDSHVEMRSREECARRRRGSWEGFPQFVPTTVTEQDATGRRRCRTPGAAKWKLPT